jgi:two-component sensor histidine kinase
MRVPAPRDDHDSFAGAILETVGLPLLALDADLRVEVANEAFLRCFQATRAQTIGRFVHELGDGQWNIPELRHLLGEILPGRSRIEDYRVEHDFEHIGRRVMRLNARRIARPEAKDSILLTIADETERENQHLEDARLLQRISTELVSDQAPEALYQEIVEAARALMRSDAASIQAYDAEKRKLRLIAHVGIHPDSAAFWEWVDADSGSVCGEALRTFERIVVPDVSALNANSHYRDAWRRSNIAAVQSTPLVSSNKRFLGMLSTHWRERCGPSEYDLRRFDVLARLAADFLERNHAIAARRRAEEERAFLMRELNHRSKNLLSIVLVVARATAGAEAKEFAETFEERVQALAANQDLLIQSDWRGVDLNDLVRSQLAHFQDLLDDRITLDGPPAAVMASASQSLGMALHELATNAAKYGALSNSTGRVAIAWRIGTDDKGSRRFRMSWRESGGPPVDPPARSGFGTGVIRDATRMNLSGDVRLGYARSGVVWELDCPVEACIEEGGERTAEPLRDAVRPETVVPRSTGPRRVLLVEDEALVALELAQVLAGAGHEVVGPAGSVRQALSLLKDVSCDAAVLDVQLGGETAEAIAVQLAREGTPFLILSGYDRSQLPNAFQSARLLPKPVRREALLAEVEGCLAHSGAP